MCKVIMPIKPIYVKQILSGRKKYEFRKILAKRSIDKIVIYETSPVMKVVAEVCINSVLVEHPDKLWELTHEFAGIDKQNYDKYYKNRETAVAYSLGHIYEFDKPKELADYGINFFPQSFVYLD